MDFLFKPLGVHIRRIVQKESALEYYWLIKRKNWIGCEIPLVMEFCKFTMVGVFVNVAHEFGSFRFVVVCSVKFCGDIGQDRMKFVPLVCACKGGGNETETAKLSTVSWAFVDVPPTIPINNSFVSPA